MSIAPQASELVDSTHCSLVFPHNRKIESLDGKGQHLGKLFYWLQAHFCMAWVIFRLSGIRDVLQAPPGIGL